MSSLAATQIPKPADEQAFERASVILWRALLNDQSVQRNGTRGQRQNGVDLFGIRDGQNDWHVGIQCKLKGEGRTLTEKEVRTEVAKALTFKPPLKEYIITTTAPDDVALQELARQITAELSSSGSDMRISIWGWNTLEERISEHPSAIRTFDPSYTPFGQELLSETKTVSDRLERMNADQLVAFTRIEAMLSRPSVLQNSASSDVTKGNDANEAFLDAQIDEYREIHNAGKTQTALPLFQNLLARVEATASGRILFRIKANIGHCLLAFGRSDEAIRMIMEAYDHAPSEPKAVANRGLALLLQGSWKELLDFGTKELELDPTNDSLAGYLIQAASFDPSADNPLTNVPSQLHNALPVQLALVDFQRQRGPVGQWWTSARRLVEEQPANSLAIQFAAEAELDETISSQEFQQSRKLSASNHQRITKATERLKSLWDEQREHDGFISGQGAGLCGNLAVGLALLGDLSDAIKIIGQGLELSPEDPALIVRGMSFALEANDHELADSLIEKLPENEEGTILKFRYFAAQENWHEVSKLHREQAALIPKSEASLIATTARLEEILALTGDLTALETELTNLAKAAETDVRATIVVAEFARRQGLADLSESCFHRALDLVDESSPLSDRLMVAYYADRQLDFATVADLLDHYLTPDHDSSDLRMLARALVNDSPIRKRAVEFFDSLPSSVRELPFYLHAEGLLRSNIGELAEAERILRKASGLDCELDNYLALFSVLYRLDRGEEVRNLLQNIDLQKIKGTSSQKMYLAQVMRKVGLGSVALPYAYGVLQSARNDQEAVLRYLGLILMSQDDGFIPTVDSVSVDSWVRLESDRKEEYSFLIENGNDRPADNILSPTHTIAARAIGLKVGEEFDLESASGSKRRWRVLEIKHKYLHALHDLTENFENRFSDARGFYRINLQEGDVQPALDEVRRISEANRKIADLYLTKNCPIGLVVANAGRNSIRFMEYIRFIGFDIVACHGTEAERLSARNMIEASTGGEVVIDTLTAWTISTMDAFDVLKAVFGELVVPQTVIDEIKSLREELDEVSAPSMSLSWHNGQFIRQEYTPENIAERRNYAADMLLRVEQACVVRPVVIDGEPNEVTTLITQLFGSHVLDAANLASTGRLLVSDDLYYRQYAEVTSKAKGVWLQAVFSLAHDRGVISHERYVKLIVGLAQQRHGHLSLNSGVLLAVATDEADVDFLQFMALANFIGTRDAAIRSHLEVSVEFLNKLWASRPPSDLRCMRVTSILLERLVRYRNDDWPLALAYVKCRSSTSIQAYIDCWVIGHFLPVAKVAAAVRDIEEALRRPRVN